MFLDGLDIVLSPLGLLWLIVGLLLGFVVGVLPGLSTSNTAALLLPFSVSLPTEQALILIMSVYAGSAFAGSVPAILVNVPGEAGSAVTALDGYQMARQGKAGIAIGIARMASTLGGVISGVVVLLVIAPLGAFALNFGAREMFIVVLLGIVLVSTLVGKNIVKGVLAGGLGLVLATIGGSPLSGQERFTFGEIELYDGIQFVPALIGLFAIGEMLRLAAESRTSQPAAAHLDGGVRRDLKDAVAGARITLKHGGSVLRATGVGVFLGIIPGVGTGVSNFVSYAVAKRTARNPAEFGKGSARGVIASEACDNAVGAATLVPTLTLGVPGSATMAVVLAQFYIQGIQPGPKVLATHGPEAGAAVIAVVAASILILPIGMLITAPLVQITKVPVKILVPVVLVLGLTGSVAYRGSLFDMGIATMFGIIGFFMLVNGYPVVPLILGLILGPMLEEHLSRALALSNGDLDYFFASPTALVLWSGLVALVAYLVISGARGRRRERAARPSTDRGSKAPVQ
ncbi:tripartite tricarboxylate transporter permease [Qaidamihabitans albus]|uniref:tripartite tricarboxylate transporter permease n=1 Tax=Qaidamihabitans albus TaxID=2795733 RepID=UPI0018F1521A|nr:tripartite tricarboxylate transporter permease [Qaidamihabitans albus]